jgi:hypothetical protein
MGWDKGEGESPELFTPTPPASPERLAMAGRLNPPPSRGRRFSRQVSDALRFNARSFTTLNYNISFWQEVFVHED